MLDPADAHNKMLHPDPTMRGKSASSPSDCHPDMMLFFAAGNERSSCPCPGCQGPARWTPHLEFARDLIVTKCPDCGMFCRGRDDPAWRPYPDGERG